jgi:DNA-binding MarR family transcriptional regulator
MASITAPGAALTAREEAAWRGLRRMQTLLAAQMSRRLIRETGLSEADYDILAALHAAPDRRLRALALRCTVQWEKSRLSHHLARMQRRGLVEREDCVEDSRGAVFGLTDAGRIAVEGAAQSRCDAVRAFVTDLLTPVQLDLLAEISDVIMRALAEDPEHRQIVHELASDTV